MANEHAHRLPQVSLVGKGTTSDSPTTLWVSSPEASGAHSSAVAAARIFAMLALVGSGDAVGDRGTAPMLDAGGKRSDEGASTPSSTS
eukprot:CAMPEP_0115875146 /NCGR_PEP_ID=MMETSP0287-20121206/24935_1 /TAXON_ID=412157 /ORGANISM="Chrysochromulina rotalis, Strain UIO044" /LENGTH=87 /DNA_ID=CAMNT_0003330377 /DNA_START=418 /DNA_END=683 /DNA_ORIENTATION=-